MEVFPKNIQNYKNSFFYRTLPVIASKWENGKSKTEQTQKIV